MDREEDYQRLDPENGAMVVARDHGGQIGTEGKTRISGESNATNQRSARRQLGLPIIKNELQRCRLVGDGNVGKSKQKERETMESALRG